MQIFQQLLVATFLQETAKWLKTSDMYANIKTVIASSSVTLRKNGQKNDWYTYNH